MIHVNMDDRFGTYGFIDTYGENDPFGLIDVRADLDKKAVEIETAVRDASEALFKAATLIDECGDEVHFKLRSIDNLSYDKLGLDNFVAIILSYMTQNVEKFDEYKAIPEKQRKRYIGYQNGAMSYSLRTDYETYDVIFHIFWEMMEHMVCQPTWWKQLKEYHGAISLYSTEKTLEFRTCALALNLVGISNWCNSRDSDESSYDEYGHISFTPTTEEQEKKRLEIKYGGNLFAQSNGCRCINCNRKLDSLDGFKIQLYDKHIYMCEDCARLINKTIKDIDERGCNEQEDEGQGTKKAL